MTKRKYNYFFIKAGKFVVAIMQVPKEYSTSLSSLQDQAIPFQFEAIKHVLGSNLGLNYFWC